MAICSFQKAFIILLQMFGTASFHVAPIDLKLSVYVDQASPKLTEIHLPLCLPSAGVKSCVLPPPCWFCFGDRVYIQWLALTSVSPQESLVLSLVSSASHVPMATVFTSLILLMPGACRLQLVALVYCSQRAGILASSPLRCFQCQERCPAHSKYTDSVVTKAPVEVMSWDLN